MRHANLLILLCLIAAPAIAQQINIPAEMTNEAALPRVMPRFAKAVIAFQQADQPAESAPLFKAQLVAGLYSDALASVAKLRIPLADDPSPRVRARYLEYVLYARSRLSANKTKTPSQSAYRKTFHALIGPLDNRTSALAVNHLSFDNLSQASQAVEQDLAKLKGKTAISLADSFKLIGDYNEREIYRAFGSTSADLIAEDDAPRYTVQKDVIVPTPDGGSVCALIVRPPAGAKLPALLQFTIYYDPVTLLRDARRSASNDYVGVIGLVRRPTVERWQGRHVWRQLQRIHPLGCRQTSAQSPQVDHGRRSRRPRRRRAHGRKRRLEFYLSVAVLHDYQQDPERPKSFRS